MTATKKSTKATTTKKNAKATSAKTEAASKNAKAVTKKDKPAKPKKVSALDAAAQVLAASTEPMTCQGMIDAMAAKGLWSSPNGKTPSATLYAAILREINRLGKEARFKKTERGHFAATQAG
jgi:hypothetical protein